MASNTGRTTQKTRIAWGEIVAFIGGAAVIGGCFMPWYRVGDVVAMGTDQAESVFVLFAGIVLWVLLAFSMLLRRQWFRSLVLVSALVTVAAGSLGVADVVREARIWQIDLAGFVDPGILIVFTGGVAAVIGMAIALRRPSAAMQ